MTPDSALAYEVAQLRAQVEELRTMLEALQAEVMKSQFPFRLNPGSERFWQPRVPIGMLTFTTPEMEEWLHEYDDAPDDDF